MVNSRTDCSQTTSKCFNNTFYLTSFPITNLDLDIVLNSYRYPYIFEACVHMLFHLSFLNTSFDKTMAAIRAENLTYHPPLKGYTFSYNKIIFQRCNPFIFIYNSHTSQLVHIFLENVLYLYL